MEHLPTVRYLARRIHERLPQHVELDDLVSAGVVGLIDAFSKFDHRKKVQFKSYAQFRIRGAILDSLRTLDWSPRELRRKGRAVEEAIRDSDAAAGPSALGAGDCGGMELTLAEYQTLLGDLKGLEIGSLHMERSEDSGDEELAYIPGAPEEDPLFRCLKGEMKQRLADAIDELPGEGADGADAVLLRRADDERDRPDAWRRRVEGFADPFFGCVATQGGACGPKERKFGRGRTGKRI